MTIKPVVPRRQASKDIDEAIAHYLSEGGDRIAYGFVDALERRFSQIAQHPGSGSQRYALELQIDGLRSWPLQRYPYLLFYVEAAECIDLWRVLQAHRDVPDWLLGR